MFQSFRHSIGLHVLPFLILLLIYLHTPTNKEGDGNNEKNAKTGEFVNGKDKPEEDAPKEIEIDIIYGIPKPKEDEVKCKDDSWYGGVGIRINYTNTSLYEVPEYYPAYKAGLRVGDILIDPDKEIRGDPGTEVIIRISRKGERMDIPVIRGKICLDFKKL